jgi:hypothetical protein
VHVGVRIDDDCIKGIVDKFSLLVNRESMAQWARLPLDFRNKKEEAAVLCTALEVNPKQLESLNGRDLNRWEEVIRDYDRIIAEDVSKLGGEVAKGDPNGYLILFDKAKYALLCSEQLQIAMQEFNAGPSLECKLPRQRIALDYGSISRVIRASGVDYFGTPLIRCSILIDKTEFGKIYMTKDIFIKAEEVFTEGYIEQRIHPVSSNIINDSRLPNCFEYIWPLSSWAK